jgi:hypothetical protein
MNCNVHVFYKMLFSNKFGFILETSLFLFFSYMMIIMSNACNINFLQVYNKALSPNK